MADEQEAKEAGGAETSGGSEGIPQEARKWAMICHLVGLAALTCIPFANIVGPLVVWLIKREEHPFVDAEGKEALNFQISLAIYSVAGWAVSFVLTFVVIGVFLGMLVCLAYFIVELVFVIMAATTANKGQHYRYPLTIRFLK